MHSVEHSWKKNQPMASLCILYMNKDEILRKISWQDLSNHCIIKLYVKK